MGDSRLNDVLPDPAEDGRAERQRVHAGLLAATDGIDTRSGHTATDPADN